MNTELRLTQVFVELADTLVDEFDALDFFSTLTERCVELLPADAAGVILNDLNGGLHVVASTSDTAKVLELFELQNDEGPCLDCFRSGHAVVNVDPLFLIHGQMRQPPVALLCRSKAPSSLFGLQEQGQSRTITTPYCGRQSGGDGIRGW